MFNNSEMQRRLLIFLKSILSISKKQSYRISHAVAQVFRRFSISSEIIGPPKGYYQSAWDWIEFLKDSKSMDKGDCQEVYPSQVNNRNRPKTIDEDIHVHFDTLEYQSPSAYVATIFNGRVWGDKQHCAVVTPEDKFLADVSKDFGKTPEQHSVFHTISLGSIYQIDGTALALTSAGGEAFYHWLYHVLPRIGMVEKAGIPLNSIDKFIINGLRFPFHRDTLSALGIPEEKVVEIRKHSHVRADKLIVPSFPQAGANVNPWVCDFFRNSFLRLEQLKDLKPAGKRIYISRQKALQRRVVNDADVFDLLKDLGFREVFLEDLSYLNQVKVLSCADVIVAPHGAGLANLVFCSPKTKIIELHGENYVRTTFWILSEAVGLDYYYLICKGIRPAGYLGNQSKFEDLLVDIDRLKETMNMAEIF